MNRKNKIIGITMLILLVAVLTYAIVMVAPTLVASVGWHGVASVGWVN